MTKGFVFSDRTSWPLDGNDISQMLDRLLKAGCDVINLTESNPTLCGLTVPQELLLKPLHKKENLLYHPSPKGLEDARKTIASYYCEKGVDISPEQIVLTSSTSEAYSYLFRLVANYGDHVLFPTPSYPLFTFLTDLNDIKMNYYELIYDDFWRIDFESLEEAIDRKTKAIVVVNPNNPTGSFIKREEMDRLNAYCQENRLAIISDEVFGDFPVVEREDAASFLNNAKTLSFVLGGISKTLGLPQMKLSWIIVSGPQGEVDASLDRLEVIADTYLSMTTPTQNALGDWFSHRKEIQDAIRARLKENFGFLDRSLENSGVGELLTLEGGWYGIVKVIPSFSEEEFVLNLLKNDHTFVHPGYFFDFKTEGFLVVSLLTESKRFQEGVSRLVKRLKALAV